MINRLTMALALAALLVLAGRIGFGQGNTHFQVEGIVRDSSGAAVPGAEVTISSGSFNASQVTDWQGRFQFSHLPIPSGTLTVSSRGFTTVQQAWDARIQGAKPLEITLTPKGQTAVINVTATRTEQRVSDTAASVTVFNQQVLATSGGIALDDKLSEVPGFTLFRRNGSLFANPSSMGVSLRGVGSSGASRALVISDGIPLNDPYGGWVYWNRVPPTAVDSVEVVQGGVSDLYGSNALGGVINIVPHRPTDSLLSLETSYGNRVTPYGSLTASLRKDPWIATVTGQGFYTDGYVAVLPPRNGSVDTAVASKNFLGEFNLEYLFSERGRAFARGSIFEDARKNGTPLQTNNNRLRQLAVGADWESSTVGAITFRAYGGPENYDQSFSAIAADRNSERLTDIQRVPCSQAGLSAQWTRTAGTHQTLAAGFEGQLIRGSSDEILYSSGAPSSALGASGRQRVWGLFGEDIVRINTRWLITGGARVDDWRNFDALSATRSLNPPGPEHVVNFTPRREQAFSPLLSTLVRIKDNLVFRASAYRAFRAPTLNELYRGFRQGNVLTLANSNLTAEHLTGAEAGLSYSAWHERMSLRGTFFWNDISDPVANVTLSSTPTLITRQRQNLGETRARGADLDAEARLTSTVTVSGGWQFVDASVTSFPANTQLVGLQVPHVPRQDFSIQARYSRPGRLTAAVQGIYEGATFDDDQNTLLLRHYFLLNGTVSRPLGHRMEIFAAGENVLNRRYDVARTPVLTSGPPILVRVGFRVMVR